MRQSALLILTVLCAAAASGAAADYKSEYKLYAAAMNEGDVDAAIRHSEEAWKQGESEIGDNRTTAILAYNFANLVYEIDPARAIPAFERTLGLIDRALSELDVNDVRLALAAAKFAASKEDKTLAVDLENEISQFEASGRPFTFVAADALKNLALRDFHAAEYKSSARWAEKAAALGEALAPKPKGLLAISYAVAGISYGADPFRTPAKITKAAELLDRAIVLFPPQKDIKSIHPLFAQTMAWRFSVNAIAESERRSKALDRVDKELDADAMCRWEQARPADCEIKWKERKPGQYPEKAISKGYVGSVLVGYDLNDVGVENTVVIADVNGEALSPSVLESMRHWKLEEPPISECRKNHLTVVSFVLK